MALRLTIGACEDGSPGQVGTRVLTSGRLTIGRSVGNDWTLVDPSRIISKFHCVVEGSGDDFRITDNSSNGVFVNGAERPLGRGNSCLLHHGDQLKIGPCRIDVALTEVFDGEKQPSASPASSAAEEPLENAALLFDKDRSIAVFAPQYRESPIPAPAEGGKDDWPFSLDASPQKAGRADGFADLDGPLGLDDAFIPPAVKGATPAAVPAGIQQAVAPPPSAHEPIPTNWNVALADVAAGAQRSAAPAEAPLPPADRGTVPERLEPAGMAPQQASACTDLHLLAAFLEGAGVGGLASRVSDPTATMHGVGEIFRIVVEGVIATLEARKTVKRELGVAATEFRPTENNPLKFTMGVDDTLETLLCGDERGYLPATQAFQDAFGDITRHQLAVLAGMQEAWADLLRRFEPEGIKNRVGNDGGVGALLGSKKSRYWDAFVQLHAAVASDAENEYRSLFYRVFGEAYERYLATRRAAAR